jgi:hypothetical protein
LRQDNVFLRLRVDSISPRLTCPLRSTGITPLPRLAQPATPPRVRVGTWRFELVTLSLHRSTLEGRAIGLNRLFLAGIVGRIDVVELQRRSALDLDHNFWWNDEVRLATFQSLPPHKSSLMSLLACCRWCITFTSWFRILKVVSVCVCSTECESACICGCWQLSPPFPALPDSERREAKHTRASFRAAKSRRSRCIQKYAEAVFVHSIIPYWTGLSPHHKDHGEGEIGYFNTKTPRIRHQHGRIWRRYSWSCRAALAY